MEYDELGNSRRISLGCLVNTMVQDLARGWPRAVSWHGACRLLFSFHLCCESIRTDIGPHSAGCQPEIHEHSLCCQQSKDSRGSAAFALHPINLLPYELDLLVRALPRNECKHEFVLFFVCGAFCAMTHASSQCATGLDIRQLLGCSLVLPQSTVNEVTGPKALSEYELGDQVLDRIHALPSPCCVFLYRSLCSWP